MGHPEYPILDSRYAPNSRVPCTDLVPFISERIVVGDIDSIKYLMRMVVEGNPFGNGWIEKSVDNILSIPFEKYVSFSSACALPELKALFIVAEKGGGGRAFMITGEIPRIVSWACIVHQPLWSTDLQSLAKKANSWISMMAEEFPETLWAGYEKFDVREIPNRTIETKMREKIIALTPAARLQLFYAVEKRGGSLLNLLTNNLTSGPIRSLGINFDKTSQELLESGLVIPSFSSEAIETAYSKQELVELCESSDVSFRKSWKKEQLLGALAKKDLAMLEKIANSKNVVSPNIQLYPALNDVVHIADEHQVGFKLLCFA
ncbi:MAG: hypothetical protein NTZ27_02380 [Ignavibacteriales bacterium]|nr:hypothetical protein [Ignavibacteriales bacterium]